MGYKEVYTAWQNDPEAWWMSQAEAIDWDTRPSKALFDRGDHMYEWFADGMTNTCWNAVDRHVPTRGDQAALIYDSPVTDTKETITYSDLQTRVATLAGALVARGVTKGDRVIVYMPMVPEAIIAMLAVTRIGAIHSVVFGGFASNELAVRIDDAQPKAILAGSCGIEPGRVVEYKPLLDGAVDLAEHKPEFCMILQREQAPCDLGPRDVDWAEAVAAADDVGWVVGHSYIAYGPLIHGNTTIVFEGKPVGTPDAGTFWRIISEYKVRSFFTAPTAFRAIKRVDPEGEFLKKYDLSHFKTLFLAGERADPDTINWAQTLLDRPVIDHWWQTELGYPAVGNAVGLGTLPVKVGSPSVPLPGYDIKVMDDDGNELPRGELGALVTPLPLPPGTLPNLWNAEDRFKKSYLQKFPGYYETGDAGYVDEDGYVWIMARTDDVINVAGHRLSTGAMEEVLAGHPDVAECAVIGVADALKGQLPMGFVCLTNGVNRPHDEIAAECVKLVRDQIGPVAAFKLVTVVDRLPKTRSGKILRATMAKIADGQEFKLPATIDDPLILDEIREALLGLGYPSA